MINGAARSDVEFSYILTADITYTRCTVTGVCVRLCVRVCVMCSLHVEPLTLYSELFSVGHVRCVDESVGRTDISSI